MSDNRKPEIPPAAPEAPKTETPNRAQDEFDRYKARLGGMTGAGAQPPPLPWAVPYAGVPGWALPPAVAAVGPGGGAPAYLPPGYGPPPAPAGARNLIEQFGETVRLGVDLVNAALGSGVRLLSGAGMGASMGVAPGYGGHAPGCGCASCCGPRCGCPSCCETLSCDPCCSPGINGCC